MQLPFQFNTLNLSAESRGIHTENADINFAKFSGLVMGPIFATGRSLSHTKNAVYYQSHDFLYYQNQ